MRLLFFLICGTTLFASPLYERVEKSQNGDYIVLSINKMITVLSIRSVTPTSLILEEVSAPLGSLDPFPPSWKEWIRDFAPGHTSWSMAEIDLGKKEVIECYSFSNGSWIQPSSENSLFATLLKLPFTKVKDFERKKIGPPPLEGEKDVRKVWNPPLVVEGKKIEKAQFEVFETLWPEDASELAGEKVVLYFDQTLRFPLPFWIDIHTSHATFSFQVIDSGSHLPSHHRSLPKRVPEFLGAPSQTEAGLVLSLKSPKYYRSFELFAVDVTTRQKQIVPIPFSLIEKEGEWVDLAIEDKHLEQLLEKGNRYKWLVVPVGNTEFYAETFQSFPWMP